MSDAMLRLGAVPPLRPSRPTARSRLCPMPTSHASPPSNLMPSEGISALQQKSKAPTEASMENRRGDPFARQTRV